MTEQALEIAVVGGGAIGGLVAAAAQAAGHEVTLCVRSPIERLEIEVDGGRREVPVQIANDPDGVHPVPWVVLATKAQDTPGAAGWLEHLAGPETTVAVLQNGIEHAERVQPFLHGGAVLPGLVYVSVEKVGPGQIRHHSGNRIVVPRGPSGEVFAGLLGGGRLQVEQDPDFITAAWHKLLTNVAANPITALTLRRIGIMRDPHVRDLARGLLAEAVAVGRAAGANLKYEDVEDVLALYDAFNPSGGSSMLYDRLAGRPLEHAHLTGAVVRTAEYYGVDVPLNRAVMALLEALDGAAAGGTADKAAA